MVAGKQIFAAVKSLLKDANRTYIELASHLELSLSGVKKLLNGDDLSYNKLVRIAEFLDTDPETIIGHARAGTNVVRRVPDDVQHYLLTNLDVAMIFWLLYFEDIEVDKLAEVTGRTQSEIFSMLVSIDKLGFIKLMPNNRVILLGANSFFTWIDEGPFITAFTKKWSAELVARVIDNPGDNTFLSLRYLKLSTATMLRLRRELQRLDREYTALARSEMRGLPRDELHPVCWLAAMDRNRMVADFRGPLI